MTYHLKLIYQSDQSESGTVINNAVLEVGRNAPLRHSGNYFHRQILLFCLNVYTDAVSLQGIILKEFPQYVSPL